MRLSESARKTGFHPVLFQSQYCENNRDKTYKGRWRQVQKKRRQACFNAKACWLSNPDVL